MRSTTTLGDRVAARALAVLFALALLPANAAQDNPHWDQTATSGGLETVCTWFSIDNQAIFSAHCNKVNDDDSVSDIETTFDLSAEVDDSCMDGLSIRVTASAVLLEGDCTVAQPFGRSKTVSDSDDLNLMIAWDTGTGTFSWKTGYGPGT